MPAALTSHKRARILCSPNNDHFLFRGRPWSVETAGEGEGVERRGTRLPPGTATLGFLRLVAPLAGLNRQSIFDQLI